MGVEDVSSLIDHEKVSFLLVGERKTYDIGFFPYPLAELGFTSSVPLRASTLWGSTIAFTINAPFDSIEKSTTVDINYDGYLAGYTFDFLQGSIDGNTLTLTFPKKDPLEGASGPPISLTIYGAVEYDADSPFSSSDPLGNTDFELQLQFKPYVEMSIAD